MNKEQKEGIVDENEKKIKKNNSKNCC